MNQRAAESPLEHLAGMKVLKKDRRHERRALEPDEVRRLLEATKDAPERFGMTGPERAILYRLAVETGLRTKELRSLTVSSFDLQVHTVTVEDTFTKNRQRAVLPLRENTAEELRRLLAEKMPNVQVFKVPDKTAKMLRADLEEARIPYIENGLYADFHALRHTTGSWLAANQVHPKVAQSIMRHSDINLTMSRYTHILRGQESKAVAGLPDLSLPSNKRQRIAATGTDSQPVNAAQNPPKKLTPKWTPKSTPYSFLWI